MKHINHFCLLFPKHSFIGRKTMFIKANTLAKRSFFLPFLSLILAAALMIPAIPVYAADGEETVIDPLETTDSPEAADTLEIPDTPEAADTLESVDPLEISAPEEDPGQADILLEEQASEYVTITVYDRQKYDWGPIKLVTGFQYPTDPSREMRISGSGTSSNNIRIQSIKWYKKESSFYTQDTSGKFSEGTWQCEMLLNGVSESNIYNKQTGYGDIRFQGFPDGTKWQGDGQSSGNITFRTTFTVKGKETITKVNLLLDEGTLKYPKLGRNLYDYMPDYSVDNAGSAKGINLVEIYYTRKNNTAGYWYEWPRVSSSDIFELDYYCLAIRLTCTDANYKFDEEDVDITVNDNYSSLGSVTLDDGSLLIGDVDAIYAVKDGLMYRIDTNGKNCVSLIDTPDDNLIPTDLVIPESIHIRGKKYTVSSILNAFEYSSRPESVYIPASVERLGYYTFYISMLKEAAFEEGSKCKSIGQNGFYSSNLKEITVPGTATTIDSYAFAQCTSLEKIVIPASVKSINSMAFQDCTALKDVYYTGTKTQWQAITISDTDNECLQNATVHYNCKSLNDCKITIPAQTYTGNILKPALTVTHNGKTLKAGTDYTVTYKNNKNPGRAVATIKGKGSYCGTQKKLFTIAYKDVPATHGYATGIYWATDKNIAAGYSGSKAGNFGVKDDITRGQVVTFLWRAAGKPEPKDATTQTFKDVPTTHNFYKAIQWAAEEDIAGGYTGSRKGYFGPNDNCTRGQIAIFLWRYLGKPEPQATTQTFSDVPTDHKFYKGIQWAYEWKVTAGNSDGTFGVAKTCNRGSCVTFLNRMPDDDYYFRD